MKNDFFKIPNYIIEKDSQYLSSIIYIMCCENKFGLSKFTLSEFIEFGLWVKPRYGKDNIISESKAILDKLVNENLISIVNEPKKITLNSIIEARITIPYEVNDKNSIVKWFKLYIEDYRKIYEFECRLKKDMLLKLYCYILSRIIRRNDGINNIQITGGNAEVFWCKQEEMSSMLNLSKGSLNTYLKVLKELGLVFYGGLGSCRKDGILVKPHNVYATNEVELDEGLKQAKYYWESNGWEFIKN